MTETDRGPAPLTPAVFHVLLALGEGPLHGYAIMKRVEAESGLKMGPGTVYGSLDRLSAAGWIAESDEAAEADGRRGRAFELTTEGETALRAEASRITRLAGLSGVRALATDPAR